MEMIAVLNTFNKFLLKNGVLDHEGINIINQKCNQNSIKNENFETNLIKNLSDYLKDTYSNKKVNCNFVIIILDIASSIYENFILQDDENIVKIIRKLLIIYKSSLRKLLVRNFLKWRLIKSFISKLIRNIVYIKKNNFKPPKKIKNNITPKETENKNNNQITSKESLTVKNTNNNVNKIYKSESDIEEQKIKVIKKSPSDNTIVKNVENFTIAEKQKEVYIRLYDDKIRRNLLHNENAKKYCQKELNECTFSPKITINTVSKNSTTPNSQPFYLKLFEDHKKKEKNMRQLNIEKENNMNKLYTFEPVINSKYKLKRNNSNFQERLKMYSKSKSIKIKQLRDEIEKSLPTPKCRRSVDNINTSTDKIYGYHRKKQEKIKKLEKSILNELGVTFKPRLNNNVNVNINTSIYERNDEFLRNKSLKMQMLNSIEDKECTFSPRVNNISTSKNSIDDLSVGSRLFSYQEKYQQNMEIKKEIYKENYTFKPEISSNTYDIIKQRDAIMEEIKNKYNTKHDCAAKANNKNDIPKINLEENTLLNQKNSKDINSESDLSENTIINTKNKQEAVFSESINVYRNKNQSLVYKPSLPVVQNLSDSKLLDFANQYITTDESLEKFQARLKEKYKLEDDKNLDVLSTHYNNKRRINHSFNQAQMSSSQINNSINTSSNKKNIIKNLKKTPLTKKITTGLEYYDRIQL